MFVKCQFDYEESFRNYGHKCYPFGYQASLLTFQIRLRVSSFPHDLCTLRSGLSGRSCCLSGASFSLSLNVNRACLSPSTYSSSWSFDFRSPTFRSIPHKHLPTSEYHLCAFSLSASFASSSHLLCFWLFTHTLEFLSWVLIFRRSICARLSRNWL